MVDFKKWREKEFSEAPNKEAPSYTELMIKLKASSDFISFPLSESKLFYLSYFKTLVKPDFIHRDILPFLTDKSFQTIENIKENLPIENMVVSNNLKEVQEGLLSGSLIIHLDQQNNNCFLLIPSSYFIKCVIFL